MSCLPLVMDVKEEKKKIVKTVLYAGTEAINFLPETKVTFHFQTKLTDQNGTIVDDSRKLGKPMQLILGRKFKLAIWETLVQAMALNEVSRFTVDKSLVEEYPIVAKAYRDDAQNKRTTQSHHCHASVMAMGLDYEDLNKLLKDPQDLEFTFEMTKVEYPGQYERELWQITNENKLQLIPQLKDEGNEFYRNSEYEKALEKYQLALTFIDQLQLREKPRDIEWNELNEMKLPFFLNIAQCKLYVNDHYAAIGNCNSALQIDDKNVKALFRRSKAYIRTWNLKEAKKDLETIILIDPSQKSAITSAMIDLKSAEAESRRIEKSLMKNTML